VAVAGHGNRCFKSGLSESFFHKENVMRRYPIAPERCPVTLKDQREKLCFTLLSLGQTTETICLYTGFSESQVSYRAKRYGLKRATYRKGSYLAQQLAELVIQKKLLAKAIRNKASELDRKLRIKVL
jgi:hypothetical protein